MGVTVTASTMPGGVTPVCDRCGIALCYDLPESEYSMEREFWDNWQCKDCNPDYHGALKRFHANVKQNKPAQGCAMKTVSIWIDGACSGNPGPGGWGAILRYGGHIKEISGYEADTTCNRMELMAAISALQAIKEPCLIHVYTDSQYVQKGMVDHIHRWRENGWCNSSGQPVKNRDLWESLLKTAGLHQVIWHWVQAHKGHRENERADCLAKMAVHKAGRKA